MFGNPGLPRIYPFDHLFCLPFKRALMFPSLFPLRRSILMACPQPSSESTGDGGIDSDGIGRGIISVGGIDSGQHSREHWVIWDTFVGGGCDVGVGFQPPQEKRAEKSNARTDLRRAGTIRAKCNGVV